MAQIVELEVPKHVHTSLNERLTHTISYDSTVLNHFVYMELHESQLEHIANFNTQCIKQTISWFWIIDEVGKICQNHKLI